MDLKFVLTEDGADAVVQKEAGLISDNLFDYFKLGEGGWELSDLYTELKVGDGGSSYNFDMEKFPIHENDFQIITGPLVLNDDGDGNLVGDGSGTINYKTGNVNVVFDNIVNSGTGISFQYKYRGVLSDEKSRIIGSASVDRLRGIFFGVLPMIPVAKNSITVIDGQYSPQTLTDNGNGILSGDGDGVIDYETGEINVLFNNDVPKGNDITVFYKYDGAPKEPNKTYHDLESESDSSLFTFKNYFGTNLGSSVSKFSDGILNAHIFLNLWEAIDDGNGNSPVFFEGGLFSSSDAMMGYFTFSKLVKNGFTSIDINSYIVY